jgi:branched-chain amino acid transport system permease protein
MGSISFLMNALITGLLLGGFYAAVSLGLTLSFGLLDIVNIAHVEFILLGSYLALLINQWFGVDLIVSGIILTPLFFALGMLVYRFYYFCFEKRGQESLRGLAFFFGILFVIEVLLVLAFGVDFRTGKISYVDTNWKIGDVDFPLRLLVPFVVSVAMVIALQAYLTRTFFGRAVMAVAQDRLALQLMGVNATKVRELAFGLSIAIAGLAGSLLIVIQPVEPSMARSYIGLVFAVCVLGGMGSIYGTLIAAIGLGIAESITGAYLGPSWADTVAFGALLATLAFKPSGLMGG